MSTPSLTPELQQALMRMLQPGGQGMQPGMMQPPQPNPQQPQMPHMGGNNQVLPSGTASPMVPGVPMNATPPRQQGQKSAYGIAAIPTAVTAIKQEMKQKKTQKARAIAGEWIAMQQDENLQKQLQEMAKSDPKLAKVLEKKQQDFVKMYDNAIKDPMSPEYQGIQMAYRDQLTQEQQKIAMQEMKGKMEEQQAAATQKQALAQKETAEANKAQKQTDIMGTVTDRDKFMEQQKNERLASVLSTRVRLMSDQIASMQRITTARIAGAKDVATIHGQYSVKTAQVRGSATVRAAQERQKTASDYIIKEYRVIDQQVAELDKQAKDIEKDLTDHPFEHWAAGDAEEKQSRMQQLDIQRQVLQQQLKSLQAKDQAFQQSGIVTPARSQTTTQPMTIPPGAVVHDFSH